MINLEVKIMSLESAKKYGYIASIIFCIIPIIGWITNAVIYASFFQNIGDLITNPDTASSFPFAGFQYLEVLANIVLIIIVLSLGALILFLIAQYRLSKYYNEPAIFRNILYSILLTIGFVIIMAISITIIAITAVASAVVTSITPTDLIGSYAPFITVIAIVVILSVIYAVLYALLWYRSFNKLGEKSGINVFKTAGLLFALGTFIPFISFIAWILAAKGYKQLQPQQPPTDSSYNTSTYTPQSPTFDRIFCSQCGTENLTNSTYCKHCGQAIQTTQTSTTV
jgi:uncharacterized membrane protein